MPLGLTSMPGPHFTSDAEPAMLHHAHEQTSDSAPQGASCSRLHPACRRREAFTSHRGMPTKGGRASRAVPPPRPLLANVMCTTSDGAQGSSTSSLRG